MNSGTECEETAAAGEEISLAATLCRPTEHAGVDPARGSPGERWLKEHHGLEAHERHLGLEPGVAARVGIGARRRKEARCLGLVHVDPQGQRMDRAEHDERRRVCDPRGRVPRRGV